MIGNILEIDMIKYVSKLTSENAEQYGIEIYTKALAEHEEISEIIFVKDNTLLARVYIDNEYTAIKSYNGILIDNTIHITSNKHLRSLCRVIGLQL